VNFDIVKKAVLQFGLKHWKEILLVVLSAAIFFKMQSDMNELQKAYDTAKQSYEQQIEGMQDIHKEELKAREEALQRYEEELEKIRKEYQKDLEKIEKDARQNQQDLEESHTEAPQEVIDEIISQFGFEYVE
tara:strand:- start:310 stop:705 length:396 start_codon:yes stop_codon:yes gene_type:complete